MTITYEKFVETYKPIKNHIIQDAPYNGCMFETYGNQLKYIKESGHTDKHVWTLLECDNEEFWIVPGYSIVNRLGYVLCEIPWESEDIQVNDNEMCTIEEAINYCISFGEIQFNIGFDKNDVTQHFNENLDSTFEGEMTLGKAKYTAIDYFEDRLGEDIEKFENELHNYYSQLK